MVNIDLEETPITRQNELISISDSLYHYAKEVAGKPFDPKAPRLTDEERRIIQEYQETSIGCY